MTGLTRADHNTHSYYTNFFIITYSPHSLIKRLTGNSDKTMKCFRTLSKLSLTELCR